MRRACRRSFLLLLALAAARPGVAAEALPVPLDAETVRLGDGRLVRLAGIAVPAGPSDPEAAAVVAGLLGRGRVVLDPEAPPQDRHGRLRAQVRDGEGGWLQGELVRRGLAVVAPAADVPLTTLGSLLALEQAARTARLGLWADDRTGPWPALRVAAERGRLVLVQGRVLEVARAQDFIYLNFGDDWRRDFTVRVEAGRRRALEKAGLDLDALEGRNVMVRGTLFEANGPMIELTHPAQIEILE